MDTNPDKDGLFKQEGYEMMGAAFEVYNEQGHGFLEDVYQESVEKELRRRGIPFQPKWGLLIYYKGEPLRQKYIPDLLVHGEIVVELKAVKMLLPEHEAQLLNYLKASRKRVGYLINFGCPDRLEWKRMVL
ncbi:MAG: GxxExxY protein [Kiritimatiellae bacterium]|nr:GxxExxY protein [Kiritimatiellia bacterium]